MRRGKSNLQKSEEKEEEENKKKFKNIDVENILQKY